MQKGDTWTETPGQPWAVCIHIGNGYHLPYSGNTLGRPLCRMLPTLQACAGAQQEAMRQECVCACPDQTLYDAISHPDSWLFADHTIGKSTGPSLWKLKTGPCQLQPFQQHWQSIKGPIASHHLESARCKPHLRHEECTHLPLSALQPHPAPSPCWHHRADVLLFRTFPPLPV